MDLPSRQILNRIRVKAFLHVQVTHTLEFA
jgi:hypothetical protein